MTASPVHVALVQTHPIWGDVDANITAMTALIADAAAEGAEVIVFPELSTTGYVYESRDELREVLADGDGVTALADASRDHGVVIVAGVARLVGDEIHNCAVLIDNGDVLASYSKTHLWDTEKAIFTPGGSLPPVCHTSRGAIGLAICYDMEFPELFRHLAISGAELVASPTNWPAGFEPETASGPFNSELLRVMGNASTNRMFVAVACRTGVERGQDWVPATSMVGPDGYPIARTGLLSETLHCEIDLAEARNKRISENNDVLSDRRTDLY